MQVKKELLQQAWMNYRPRASSLCGSTVLQSFLKEAKITKKQWKRYVQTGRIYVTKQAAISLQIMATYPSNHPHFHTICKIIEARTSKE